MPLPTYTVSTDIIPTTAPTPANTITGEVTLFVPNFKGAPDDMVCFTGTMEGGVAGLKANYATDAGTDNCLAGNGCGTHIHGGTNCGDDQGGHWFTGVPDPWTQVGYMSTDGMGSAEFSNCVQVGYDVQCNPDLLLGKPFIIHNSNGSRASCGLIQKASKNLKAAKCAKAAKSD